ncbi:MAG: calcium-binding protein, partial [Pseudomonadota bacterium]
MADNNNDPVVNDLLGTVDDDGLNTTGTSGVDRVNGHEGSDIINTGDGTDLAAGDQVGAEWQFVDGKWVYDASAIVTTGGGFVRDFNDVIRTGAGDDVLLGNGGWDKLFGGQGGDLVNAGTGADQAFGG